MVSAVSLQQDCVNHRFLSHFLNPRVMAFYVNAPRGTISLQKLTRFAQVRLQFLLKVMDTGGDRIKLHDIVMDEQTVEGSECLIEGSARDKISHFMLRLACYKNPEMTSFLINAETLLFDWRFSCMTEDELSKLFKSLDPSLLFCQNNVDTAGDDRLETFHSTKTSDEIRDIKQTLLSIKQPCGRWRKVVKKYLSGEQTEKFYVEFQNVLNLVRRKKVILRKGVAAVGYCHLQTVVTDLFRRLLYLSIANAQLKVHDEDERIFKLTKMLQSTFKRWHSKRLLQCYPDRVSHRDINDLAVYFPPCMSHALQLLRARHRLGHHTRLQLTLFLKEVGLPVHEALMFWRDEYSQTPQGQGHRCNHNWKHNERRYTYNIRHLYGLEGSRINYRGHSCQYLQEEFRGHQEEGGCPFSHFDIESIGDIVKVSGFKGDPEAIVNAAANGKPSCACTLLLYGNMKNHSVNISNSKSDFQVAKDTYSRQPQGISENYSHTQNNFSEVENKVELCHNKEDLNEEDHATKHADMVNGAESVLDRRHISKPINYYFSYKNFVERLKSNE